MKREEPRGSKEREIGLLCQVMGEVEALKMKDEQNLDALCRRTEMLIRRVFGDKSHYLKDLQDIEFSPSYYPTSSDSDAKTWKNGQMEFMNLLKTMVEELRLFEDKTAGTAERSASNPRRVFVVHGRDEEMKQAVARTLERLDLKAIILHEQPNQGRTIIEKFVDYSDVSFAIVLLSPDDMGYPVSEGATKARHRARQNVIFELGFFLGRLGREKVAALYREKEGFEVPSDYGGVLFVPYDNNGKWAFDLGRELKAAGYDVDLNRLA